MSSGNNEYKMYNKKSSRRARARRVNYTTVTLFLFTLFLTMVLSTQGQQEENKCQSEEDLNFETCNLNDLPKDALIAICDRVGLDMENHMFPYLDEELDGEGAKESERPYSDYVLAARECLIIEDETDRMLEEDPEGLAELERSLLSDDPALLAEIVADVLTKNPDLVTELQIELQKEDPVLYNEILAELGDGKTLADRPEILAELVAVMLADDPNMLEKLDEEVSALMEGKGNDDGEHGISSGEL